MAFHAAKVVSLELLALAAGIIVLVWAVQNSQGFVKKLSGFCGYLIVGVALLSLLCTGLTSLKYAADCSSKQGCAISKMFYSGFSKSKKDCADCKNGKLCADCERKKADKSK